MCSHVSHDLFFRTDKKSSIWRQDNHANIVGAFHLSRRVSEENRACSFSIHFFKITDPFDGRSFLMCSHDQFFGTNKIRILKSDRVNGPLLCNDLSPNGPIKHKINLQFRLRPNRNACKVHDFEKFGLRKYFIFPIQKYYNLIWKNWTENESKY